MDAPYTIASLPKPLDSEHGKIQASPVYGIRNGRKRKRREVAVGIDGEGVNVYDLQDQSLVTSYAVPSQTYFCHAPCSLYCRDAKTKSVSRRTFFIARNSPQDTKRRLVCLTEEVHGDRNVDGRPTGPKKTERRLEAGDVVGLDTVTSKSDGLHVIVTYRDGRVSCIDGDLLQTLWEHSCDEVHQGQNVEFTYLTNMEDARKGLLAGRPDAIARFESVTPTDNDLSQTHLLCQILRTETSRYLQVYGIRPFSKDVLQTNRPRLQLCTSHELPASKKQGAHVATYELHPASGRLYQLLKGVLTVFDLNGTLPRIATTLGGKSEPILSFARCSGSSVLVITAEEAVVHELSYGSRQASVGLAHVTSAEDTSRPLMLTEDASTVTGLHAIAYYAELGILAGLAGAELMVLQLTGDLGSSKRLRSNSTLLADALFQSSLVGAKAKAKSDANAAKWNAWKADLDRAARNDDAQELERIASQTLKLNPEPYGNYLQARFDLDKADDEMEEAVLALTPASFDTININHKKAMYLLGSLFEQSTERDSTDGPLMMTTSHDLVYQWLALTGYLTAPRVQQALQTKTNTGGTSPTVKPGDIMIATRLSTRGFELVHDMISLPIHWDVKELVQAVRLLVQSFETPLEGSQLRALPAPQAQANDEDAVMTNGTDADADSHADSEILAAERELQLATSALSTGLETRSETFRLVLTRLQAFPQSATTKAMRELMTIEELIFFTKILRIELVDGGWTSRYVQDNDDVLGQDFNSAANELTAPSNLAGVAIGTLMGCAVDAIGVKGWLLGQSGDVDGSRQMLTELKNEVSAAVEGLFELTTVNEFIKGMQGYELFKEEAPSVGKKRRRPDVAEEDVMIDEIVPMGFKLKPAVAGTEKVASGKKHVRADEIERRARVGKYSIDRIRF